MFRMNMEGTKWTIFEVAVNLFSEHGYANVSIRDIASTAHIRPSSIYYHFKSKNEILEDIIEYYDYYFNLFLPPLDQILPHVETENPDKVLRRLLFRFNAEMEAIMTKVLLIVMVESFNNNEQAQAIIDKNVYHTPRLYLQAILTKMQEQDKIGDIDIDIFTMAFIGLCHSCALRIHSSFPITWEEFLESMEMLLSVIRKKGAGLEPARFAIKGKV